VKEINFTAILYERGFFMSMKLLGIDVSKYQGNINWTKVAADNIKFAIIRAGYGRTATQKDEYFEANYSGASAAKLPVGVYWYSYATNVSGAEAEAEACLKVIRGKTFQYPVFYDMEEDKQAALGKTTCTNLAIAFCNKIAAAGYKTGVYGNKYFLTNYIDFNRLGKYYVWLAHYTTTTDFSKRYDMHQFSSTGRVNGISGKVDLNYGYTEFAGSSDSTNTPGPSAPNPSITVGKSNALNNTNLYASSAAANRSAVKSGTYYVYDGIVVNGRIRITNSSGNVGRTPMSSYVSGWMNLSDTGSVAAPSHSAGTRVSLANVNLYASSDAKSAAARISGTYYLYDGKTVNGRMRITNASGKVGKTPVSTYVTGWINKSDVR